MTDTQIMILIGVVILAAFALIAVVAVRWSRRRRLRRDFGPEYEHTVEATGDQRKAEKELERRQKRHKEIQLREIPAERKREYRVRWRRIQADFVESPRQAVAAADNLLTEVLRDRGFPVENFTERHDEISVVHPQIAADYRKANAIAERDAAGEATTEELREAMICYRRLFEAEVGAERKSRARAPQERQTQDVMH
jgi:hypothetical protein